MIGIATVLKTLAKNNPSVFSLAKKADISVIRYMEAIKAIPIMEKIRFVI